MSHILNKSACDKDVNISELTDVLPFWETYILEAKLIEKETSPQLYLKFLIDAHNVEEIRKWLAELQESNKTTYSIYATMRTAGKYINFKQRLVCQHKTRHKNVHNPTVISRSTTKNTNCPSRLTVVLHAIKSRFRGKDKERHALLCKMPCEITFFATHNHDLTSYDSLKFRKVSPEVRARLVDLFQNGHSPISALKVIKDDIQLNNENYEEMLVDRRYCPTYEDCYYLYKNRFRKKASSNNVEGKYAEYIKVLHKRDYPIGSSSDEASDTQDEDDPNENLGHEFEAYEDLMTVESDPDDYLMQNDTDNEEYLIKFEGDSDENFIQTDNEYKEFVIEISNDPEETIVQDENVVETIIVDKDITKFIPVSDDREASKSVLSDINNIIDGFIEKSPTETRVGLEALYKTLVKIQDPSAFTTCCTVFGSVMQFKPTTRKTTLSDANGLVEDSSRKVLNGMIEKPIIGHNRSKERRKAALLLNDSGLL